MIAKLKKLANSDSKWEIHMKGLFYRIFVAKTHEANVWTWTQYTTHTIPYDIALHRIDLIWAQIVVVVYDDQV